MGLDLEHSPELRDDVDSEVTLTGTRQSVGQQEVLFIEPITYLQFKEQRGNEVVVQNGHFRKPGRDTLRAVDLFYDPSPLYPIRSTASPRSRTTWEGLTSAPVCIYILIVGIVNWLTVSCLLMEMLLDRVHTFA